MRRLLSIWVGGAIACCNLLGCDVVKKTEVPEPVTVDVTGRVESSEDDCSGLYCAWRQERAGDACEVSQLAPPAYQAALDDPPMSVLNEEPFFLAMDRVWLGQTTLGGDLDPVDAWETFGFDLDGRCTNSSTCVDSPDEPLCLPRAESVPVDGAYCADNAFARLVGIASTVEHVGPAYGLTEQRINCGLRRGEYNTLIRISGYNGLQNDDLVRLDIYSSPGLERMASLTCPDDDPLHFPHPPPGSPWFISADSLDGVAPADQDTANSKFSIPDAYVVDGYLVGHLPDGFDWTLHRDRSATPGWRSKFATFHLLGKLQQNKKDGIWEISQGVFAGVQAIDRLLESFREVRLCGESLDLVNGFISEYADMPISADADALAQCEGVSTHFGFAAYETRAGQVMETLPRVSCCEEENRDSPSCTAGCGDGVLDPSWEACDTEIPVGSEGACPIAATCAAMQKDPCRPMKLVEDGCRTACVESEPIAEAADGDGCCPEGVNAAMDAECQSRCGDGVRDAGETCDPPGSCPTAETCNVAEELCLAATLSGDAATCSAECTVSERACQNDDGCCGGGCTNDDDNDCSTSCGNGIVESDEGERCEGDRCPTDCEPSPTMCMRMELFGSVEQCDARCVELPITSCTPGDGCCPSGCSAVVDDDCEGQCGNDIQELGEECDDGNTEDGDDCSSSCEKVGDEAQCKILSEDFEGKTTAECIDCVCQNCAKEAADCGLRQSAEENVLCQNLVVCGLQEQCRGPLCLGVCPDEIAAAAGVEVTELSNPDVARRYTEDEGYPIFEAGKFSECVAAQCGTECPDKSAVMAEPPTEVEPTMDASVEMDSSP